MNSSAHRETDSSFRLNEMASRASFMEKLKLFFRLLSPSRLSLIPSIVDLILSCNDKDLVNGNGLYQEYFFGGKTPLIRERLPLGDIRMFESEEIITDIMSHGNRFNANPEASELLHRLIGKIVPDYTIDSEALKQVLERSRTEDKSLVLLSNHLSHLDAPVLDYILRKEGYTPRFVCGSFMFYNEHIRPLVIACDTVFVFGPKDQKSVLKSLFRGKDKQGKQDIMNLMKSFQNDVSRAIAQSKTSKEVVVLFPYAGRAVEELGCKSEGIPNGMESILSDTRSRFCTISIFGQRDALPGGGGGSVLNSFSLLKPIHPHIAIGESFAGGEKTLEQIHENMLRVAKTGMDTYNRPMSDR